MPVCQGKRGRKNISVLIALFASGAVMSAAAFAGPLARNGKAKSENFISRFFSNIDGFVKSHNFRVPLYSQWARHLFRQLHSNPNAKSVELFLGDF